jgi:peptidoglycan hydrolase-like amidase/putative cell wall-binding protein
MLGVVVAMLWPAPPARAEHVQQGCGPAGGQPPGSADPTDADFTFTGHGWGHGAGMSQYGARGAARLGCGAPTITSFYYPGTSVAAETMPSSVRVGLFERARIVRVKAAEGDLQWQRCDAGGCQDWLDPQPNGKWWQVIVHADSTLELYSEASDQTLWRGGDASVSLRAQLSGLSTDDPQTKAYLSANETVYARGALAFQPTADGAEAMTAVVDLTGANAMDAYLYGLAEMPASWDSVALQTQALAGRSYAMNRRSIRDSCRCHLYATVKDQAYHGYQQESQGRDGEHGEDWREAVESTSGQTIQYEGRTITAYYSSSHGGSGESPQFVFGGGRDHDPLDDSRWDAHSDNPYRTWQKGVTAEQLGSIAGLDKAVRVERPEPTGYRGRVGDPDRGYGGLAIYDSRAQGAEPVVLSGSQVRSRLGLRSTLFSVEPNVLPRESSSPSPSPTGSESPSPSPSPTESESPSPSPSPTGSESPSPSPSPSESESATIDRVSGSGRVATAVSASQRFWDSAGSALLATAEDYPDALAASPLAARLDAPMLLTPTDELADSVRAELSRLGVNKVWLLGGDQALSPAVERELSEAGYATERLGGSGRYDTAQQVASQAGLASNGEVLLALGQDWPDAVALGALVAAGEPQPVLLTGEDSLPEPTKVGLEQLEAETVTIVGGIDVISSQVTDELEGLGYGVRRLAGPSRFATSAAVADEALSRTQGGAPMVFASGGGYADALAAGALAARVDGTLSLVPQGDLTNTTRMDRFLSQAGSRLTTGVVVGGELAVSERVADQLLQHLQG